MVYGECRHGLRETTCPTCIAAAEYAGLARLDPLSAPPRLNDVMRRGLVASLRDAEASLERCWDAGQMGGYIREQSMEGLSRVRSVIRILEQLDATE